MTSTVMESLGGAACDAPVGFPVDPELADDARLVEMLHDVEPGPLLVMMLRSINLSALDPDARIDVVAAWERHQAWAAAQAQVALASLVQDVATTSSYAADEAEWRAQLVAAELRWSPGGASHKLDVAARLVNDLPATQELLAQGAISLRHATALAEAVEELSADEAAAVEAAVLDAATKQTVAQFIRTAKAAALAAAPELAAENYANAAQERAVRRYPRPNGMAAIFATMPAADAETVFLALDAQAQAAAGRDPQDETPIAARRADALLDWAQDALAQPDLPRKQGRRVEVQVVIDLPTLLGLADNPAELIGYGPIPSEAAVELAADPKARWRRLVVEPVTGHLLDYGTTIYRPPQGLRDYLVARDRSCRFPGCRRRADLCDIDHVCPAGQPGGRTASCNCCTLCRKHHRLKTHGKWQLEIGADSSVLWTAPNGRRFWVAGNRQLS